MKVSTLKLILNEYPDEMEVMQFCDNPCYVKPIELEENTIIVNKDAWDGGVNELVNEYYSGFANAKKILLIV